MPFFSFDVDVDIDIDANSIMEVAKLALVRPFRRVLLMHQAMDRLIDRTIDRSNWIDRSIDQ